MQRYNEQEVRKITLEYFNGNELACDVWIKKYALKDSEGNIYELDPSIMHIRLSNEIHRIEKKYLNPLDYQEIYDSLNNFQYIILGGSNMSGIGNDFQLTSLSNCFVIDSPKDSIGGLCYTRQEQQQLMKRRGGVGYALDHIRKRGSKVNNAAISATGIQEEMEQSSNATKYIAQDNRRGALLLCIDINNPNAEDFINAKVDLSKVNGANISVKIDNRFMQSINDDDFKDEHNIKLWDQLVKNNWQSAEPGLLFIDTIHKESPLAGYGNLYKEISTNP